MISNIYIFTAIVLQAKLQPGFILQHIGSNCFFYYLVVFFFWRTGFYEVMILLLFIYSFLVRFIFWSNNQLVDIFQQLYQSQRMPFLFNYISFFFILRVIICTGQKFSVN